ncbi:hypothetical protein BGZ52_009123 [Haplosporangium bisporale]|nr:hypothetical protein BGZ52_009123 [Haplosporangium bisporale]KAF9211905.1 hypothetical protein BGZ59_007462 [Podila verticillata]KAI9242523.1 MAG: hypothetical protein BYD32DRAFT_456910 [Podila humilis]KFH64972.1 hypothetical protein MVEG_09700 [Podila verticillata NRRL 6337]
MDTDNQGPPQDQPEGGASTTTTTAVDAKQTQDASHVITTPESLKAVSQELAEEFSVESLTTPAIRDAQAQIQTVALQMDGIRSVIAEAQDQMPAVSQQTKNLLEAADALQQMMQTIDQLALLVDSVAANVQQVSGEVEEAEKQLSSQALQPLQAVLETFKMGPKGFRS